MQVARLYKRGRVWWCWYYNAAGERVYTSCKTRDRQAAERVALELERRAGAPDVPATTTEAACASLLADRVARGRSPETVRFLRCKLGHLVRLFGATAPLRNIDARAADKFAQTRVAEGASRYTVAHELGALRAVLRLARRRGEYDRDPQTVLPMAWDNGYQPRKRHLTRPQVDKLLAALPERAAHLAFMVATGARLGESLRSRPEDWSRRTVLLRGTKTKLAARTVPILPHVADLAARAKAGSPYRAWGNIRRDIGAACKRAGLPTVSPNDLRRSAATWLVEGGAPSSLVAALLGHSTSRMVERVYGRVEGEALKLALASVTQLLQRRRKRAARGGSRKPKKSPKKP